MQTTQALLGCNMGKQKMISDEIFSALQNIDERQGALYITAREACENFMKNRNHSCTTEPFTLSTYIHQGKHSLKTVWSIMEITDDEIENQDLCEFQTINSKKMTLELLETYEFNDQVLELIRRTRKIYHKCETEYYYLEKAKKFLKKIR